MVGLLYLLLAWSKAMFDTLTSSATMVVLYGWILGYRSYFYLLLYIYVMLIMMLVDDDMMFR